MKYSKHSNMTKNACLLALFAVFPFSAYAQYAQVIDNHPDGGPGATGQSVIVDADDPNIAPPHFPVTETSGCADYHYHGELLGHPDPAPSRCGHGIVVFLEEDESQAERIQPLNIQQGIQQQFFQEISQNRVVNARQRGGGARGNTFNIDGEDNSSLDAGLSAGDVSNGLGFWANYSRVQVDSDLSSIAFDSTTNMFMAGVDTLFTDNIFAGLSVGLENGTTNSRFNNGKASTHGVTVAPYFAYFIDDAFSVDVVVGYSTLDMENSFTVVGAPAVSADHDAERWFSAINMNHIFNYDAWLFNSSFGYSYVSEKREAHVNTDGVNIAKSETELGQLRFGTDLSYTGKSFEPFMSAFYQYNVQRDKIRVAQGLQQPSNDRSAFDLGIGVRYFNDNGLSGQMSWSGLVDQDDFDSNTFSLTIRLEH